jgi:hypothetical protein
MLAAFYGSGSGRVKHHPGAEYANFGLKLQKRMSAYLSNIKT